MRLFFLEDFSFESSGGIPRSSGIEDEEEDGDEDEELEVGEGGLVIRCTSTALTGG